MTIFINSAANNANSLYLYTRHSNNADNGFYPYTRRGPSSAVAKVVYPANLPVKITQKVNKNLIEIKCEDNIVDTRGSGTIIIYDDTFRIFGNR